MLSRYRYVYKPEHDVARYFAEMIALAPAEISAYFVVEPYGVARPIQGLVVVGVARPIQGHLLVAVGVTLLQKVILKKDYRLLQ
jgi:hypothetical protein